ncbi:hypothetical protein CLG96_08915 [Sphingomonas oleivorans]|uniref:Flagellar FliJ protein n=1 Tax=Sphingomonas oleivorans TaxID=1735121 RepID=A0A2T5FYE7_9SPHN|nr:flagellar FliJ family protein [Sphingomonas oleivorans]PTQ11545.1 hypothetical protein CLG96_08915 [Sphingomonas oleivorans]
MKALADRRARVVRVRRVQHLQAASEAANAQGRLDQLEDNAARLTALRSSLSVAPGMSSGAALANAVELAQRLDMAREGLASAISNARTVAADRAADRLDARRRQESAEKLEMRAVAEMQRMIELRMSSFARLRPARPGEEDEA